MNRRQLLKAAAGFAGAAALSRTGWAREKPGELNLAALETRLAHDPRRPQFHLLPKRNWMNDPNGPIYWNGQYHMFFQYNPHAAVWGDMHWGHAVSPDMVYWKHLPIALAPTPGGPDAAGCFSGTAVVDNGVVTVLYTGVVNSNLANATLNDGQHVFRESQCLATSTDPDLKVWKKRSAPVIDAPPRGMRVTGFRDPSPWRSGDGWYLALGSGTAQQGADVLLYRSKDLRHWQYLHKLVSGKDTEKKAVNPVANGDMWECPDFFALGEKHVLIHSSEGKVHWQTGVLDQAAMRFHPEKTGILDDGAYYAAKTQLDGSGQRVIWGWIPELRPVAEYKAAGWACMMSLPRVLRIKPDGGLGTEFHPSVHRLRGNEQNLNPARNIDAQLKRLHISKATGELQAQLARRHQPFALSLLGKLPLAEIAQPLLKLAYDPSSPGEIRIDDKAIPVSKDGAASLQVHIYVDGSVAEVIFSGGTAYTTRFYYAGDVAPDIYLKLEGPEDTLVSLQMWQIKPISPDRLTS